MILGTLLFCDIFLMRKNITRETNTKYMYFKGCFENNTNNPDGSSKEKMENPISFDRINDDRGGTEQRILKIPVGSGATEEVVR